MDAWSRCANLHILPPCIIQFLEVFGIRTLDQISHPKELSIFGEKWKYAQELHVWVQWHQDLDIYTNTLPEANVRIQDREDKLIWALTPH